MACGKNVVVTLVILVVGAAEALSMGGIVPMGASGPGQMRAARSGLTGNLVRPLPTPDWVPTAALPTPIPTPTPTPGNNLPSGDGW